MRGRHGIRGRPTSSYSSRTFTTRVRAQPALVPMLCSLCILRKRYNLTSVNRPLDLRGFSAGRATRGFVITWFLGSKCNNWLWPCLADFCKALSGRDLCHRPRCCRPLQTQFSPAPSPTACCPGRFGIDLSRYIAVTCAAICPLDSSWRDVYIRPLSCSRKVFPSLRLRQCCPLFLDLGVSEGNKYARSG